MLDLHNGLMFNAQCFIFIVVLILYVLQHMANNSSFSYCMSHRLIICTIWFPCLP